MANENFLPGLKPVLELLRSAPGDIDQIYLRKARPSRESAEMLDLCRAAKVRFALVPDDALARLCPGVRHQGVLARLRSSSRVAWETLLTEAAEAVEILTDLGGSQLHELGQFPGRNPLNAAMLQCR